MRVTIHPWLSGSLLASLAFVLSATFVATSALAQQADPPNDADAIARGRYLATAADCAACHQDKHANGSPFGGGTPISTPMGPIYTSNITPDKAHGIGNWTFEQFRDAMRHGRSPTKGYLYPAMPYTAYARMTDDDLHSLYTYLMKGVAPSTNAPPRTQLPFPFIRQSMFGWNVLFLHPDPDAGATAAPGSIDRGRYVAETLGHCTTCHTPRNALFGEDTSKRLSGAQVGNWYAPNITPDKTGIGDWSDQELVEFLTLGHNSHAIAGGDMGLAVSRSLSKLTPDDVQALVRYLHSVPPIATPGAVSAAKQVPPVNILAVEPQQKTDLATLTNGSGVDGARLFEATCASCHGASGGGSADGQHPDLSTNSAVRMHLPDNLVMTIADGVHRNINGHDAVMPGFADNLTDAQIAAIATYVRGAVAESHASAVSAADVTRIRAGDIQQSWLIENASTIVIVAVLVALIALAAMVFFLARRFGRRRRAVP